MPEPYNYQKGDLVQMTRLGLSRRQKNTLWPFNEDTRGLFVRHQGWTYIEPKHKMALVRWYTGKQFPAFHEQLVRLDYLEPSGEPR